APIPSNSQLVSNSATLLRTPSAENNATMNATMGSTFSSPWAEVAWFLLPQGSTIEPKKADTSNFGAYPNAPLGAPLYGLYRAQSVVAADTANWPPRPQANAFATAAGQPGIACYTDPVSTVTTYWNPNDLAANPALGKRTFTGPGTRAATLVLKNVLCFEV